MDYLSLLKEQLNGRIAFREKRPGINQLLAPFYHEDGDMMELYLEASKVNGGKIRVCDHGMTLMRLSYSFELDTENKQRIFNKILTENQVGVENGNIYLETSPEAIYPAVMQFVQAIAKVSNMRIYKREVIQSLFYEMLEEFIEEKLAKYNPSSKVFPIEDRDDLEVDFAFEISPRPIYLFGVKDTSKARLVTISCLEFQKKKLPFKSYIVHEDFEELPKKDRTRITSAADKQFPSLDDFRLNAESYIERDKAA
ncbi:DUF1828 domain-containing protein [candidate division TA06 bacterium]|uniref:DUF1828 domain-containing protein n=1 Tax=candidate division TA06 bacterium TaxID=2250710 RepID=A0A933MJT8_UNCT6|nr:DUF1828 domain-containing protein [candidate division TA06 bacterium]